MSNASTLMERNSDFANTFDASNLSPLPMLRSVVLTCVDARVDPAHVLGLELGEAVVFRNNGGRVTQQVIDEVAALAFLVAKMDGEIPGPFELILMQHTQCGAERFADPQFQAMIKQHIGVDVSEQAITSQDQDLEKDIERLRKAEAIPDYIVVSAYLYDVQTGRAREIAAPEILRSATGFDMTEKVKTPRK